MSAACGGNIGDDPDGAPGDADSPAPDGDGDGDADSDADADGEVDVDADEDVPIPESCDFNYDETFTTALPPPPPLPRPAGPPAGEESDGTGHVAYAEPEPDGYFRLAPKDPDDPDLVMPDHGDSMPLFERARAWDEARRCYETPAGVMLLTEPEAWQLYRDIAELTTGVAMDATPGVRTVVGIRGAYPGTFEWHGNAPNRFNDTIVLLWIDDDGAHHVREWPVNTDTGARDFGFESSSSLLPNRRYLYINGWHRGYNALHVDEDRYRVADDTNNNGHWDSARNGWLPPRTGDDYFRPGGGHNIHMGALEPPLGSAAVDVWSAGCQVIPGITNWTEFIFRAWTGEGDPVDYFLVDARDIAPAVWWGECEPDGTHECPFPIDDLPFTHDFDTADWAISDFDLYNCSDADESGPEVVYLLTLDRSGTLSVAVDCVEPVDIDVHLLGGDDPDACIARDHVSFDYDVTPGRYLIVADTWADGSGPLVGPYTLTVDLI